MARVKVRYIFAVAFAIIIIAVTCVFLSKRFIARRKYVEVDVVRHFTFSDPSSLEEWKPKGFRGRTDYTIVSGEDGGYLRAVGDHAASALYYKINIDMSKRPILSWKWRVEKFPRKKGGEDLQNAKKDDFGARVYVIFPSFFFTGSKALEYIWTEGLEEGMISASPYSANLQLIVAESGRPERNGWVHEERDLYEDYVRAFGEPPKKDIGAIAVMSDGDSTGSVTEALFDDIKIGYKRVGDEQ